MNGQPYLEHDWYPRPIPANVAIGARSWLYSSFAFVHYRSQRAVGVRIGNDSGVYHGSFFDLGPDGEVEIGDFCTLVGAIIATNTRVAIRDYAFIAHEVVIADTFAAIPFPVIAYDGPSRVGSSAGVIIGRNSWIGARAVLLSGARIGEGAIVGAAAVVDFEVPPFSVVAGNPARIVRVQRQPSTT